ncbi:discoidin domain-containing protein [Radiobacillus deserti]|uniref:Discoidin domain-containing protein n=2 Tax=Radiobacillus deserti TaxID=2594883 RepID=A0A516KKQ4_9BACI|nr:discoidin domain-containing protein [Radiobacillus deserti]
MRMTKNVLKLLPVLAVAFASFFAYQAVSKAADISEANQSMFGQNVYIFEDSMADSDIQKIIDQKYAEMENGDAGAEFTDKRVTFLFKPGEYDVDIKVGFYTTVAGLGKNPDDVKITGSFNVDAKWADGNGTRNFWRSVENFSVVSDTESKWAVSQAAPMRRMHFNGDLLLWDLTSSYQAGWVSGGYLADSKIDGQVSNASQQQFFSRNNSYDSWSNSVWNNVLVGDANPPSNVAPYPEETWTIIEKTPKVNDKPYLYVDQNGEYRLFIPDLRENTKGVSWENGDTPGHSLSMNDFYIADPSDSVTTINAALDQGKHLIFTPGVYHVDEPIEVNNPDTIVYGFGYPTLVAENNVTAMKVADVDGVEITGLLFDAGSDSEKLLEVGPENSSANHATNPTTLHDVFFRVGGSHAGKAEISVEINSDDVIVDHFWVWRADHGEGVGWNVNTGANGLVVNGDDVTAYGLFVEHYQEYQTLWNGENGRVFFYQNEIPYDVPNQEVWMAPTGQKGYAAYKVADHVTSHELWGAGSYSYFRDADVDLYSSFEAPNHQGINMNHMTTVWLNGTPGSEITHVINDLGDSVYDNGDHMVANITKFEGTNNPSDPEETGVLDRTGWTATTSVEDGEPIAHLLDGNEATRWSTGTAMRPGQSITIDMKASKTFDQIVMDSTGSNNDYARGYDVYVSNDGTNWGNPVASGTGETAKLHVTFPEQQARYIKVVQTGSASNWWSITEFHVIGEE